jgi:hypothetical protein
MRPLRRSLPRLVLALALVLGDAGGALAYFAAAGAATAQATVGSIVGPSSVTATQTGANIAVSWSAATMGTGAAVQGYTVTRSDGTTVCGSPTLVTTLSCTDSSVPSGTYTYTVKAVYNSWHASATSPAITVLTAPSITSNPPSVSASTSASFSFTGGNGSSYQCKLDSGAYTACTSPTSYSGLAQGSHTFYVDAARGSSTGPVTSYTWTVDTVAPTQVVTLASGASSAYLSGTSLYYEGNAAGSFKLVDTVTDGGSGPASATFPSIATTGWTHAAETVATPSGGPYTSGTFSWTANPSAPASYTITGKDLAGNSTATSLTFVSDTTAPTGGALTVNGTAATTAGSTSTAANSTSFTIGARTDYTDGASGLKSSVLTVQSESLSGSTCGAAGSGGPFTTATTISGTTQPSGIQAGYCYAYTLTGTDNVGNVASISTTVVDNAVSFTVTKQPTSVTAGTATASTAVVLTAIKNGATDTSYTGAALTWGGANNSPSGATPTLPASPTWTAGQATFGITLVKAETETLTVTDGTRSATFAPITVNAGAASVLAWTSISTTTTGTPAGTCYFTCTYTSGFGNGNMWTASVSVTDSEGNTVTNLGIGHLVLLTLGGIAGGKGTVTPAILTIASTGPAVSTAQLTYKSVANGNFSDTLTATSSGYSSATATFNK